MKLQQKTNSRIKVITYALLIIGFVISSIPQSVLADNGGIELDDATSMEFYRNKIYYYNPRGTSSGICFSSSVELEDNNSGGEPGNTDDGIYSDGRYDALQKATRDYGRYAMNLQAEYGSPWEVIFAQMQEESQTGTANKGVSKSVADQGYYNWLGISNSGDAGTYTTPGGRKWAMFSTVEEMMNAWAGYKVLRGPKGYYNKAFIDNTDPTNYNFWGFVHDMIYVYAPPEDGNNTEQYIRDITSFIEGPIEEVRINMGWPSSTELATNGFTFSDGSTIDPIPIGGEIGMDNTGSSSSTVESESLTEICGPVYNDLASYVLVYAWPEYHSPNYFEMQPSYEQAVEKRIAEGKYVGGGAHPGIDCGGFVTTLLQESGFDPDYGGGGAVASQRRYVESHDWQEIDDISSLQPGDVAFEGQKHTFVYVGTIDGFGSTIASASYGGSSSTPQWRAPMAGKENLTRNITWYRKPQE